jgi:hypothetical protein
MSLIFEASKSCSFYVEGADMFHTFPKPTSLLPFFFLELQLLKLLHISALKLKMAIFSVTLCGSVVVKALRCKPEGRGFKSR